jgi:hypothetical protein
MTLTVTPIGDNPATPGSIGYVYASDQLIAGDLKLVTQGFAMITGGLKLPRGTIMGKMTIGAVTGAPKAGGNTGNGTLTLLSPGTQTKTGVYQLRFVSPTNFTLVDPNGVAQGAGALGVYASPALNFTTTAGATPFIAGDGFDITVAVGSSAWKKSVKGAADGSQAASGILVDDADATLGDVNSGIYLTGEFNENRVAYDASWTLVELRDALRPWNIFLKSAVTANPPS